MREEFVTWLNDKLHTLGWNYSELARRMGNFTPSGVSRAMSENGGISYDFCVGVARAFELQPEELLRQAGLLPALPPEVREEREVQYLIRTISSEEREAALAMLRGLAGYRPGIIPQMTVSEVRASYDHVRVGELPEAERSLFQAIFKLLWQFSSPEEKMWAVRWFTQAVDVHTMDDQEREPALEDSEDDR